jgi:accessory gene regulator protein AgrB
MLAYIRHLFSSEELSAFDYGILCILLDTLDFLPVIILSFLYIIIYSPVMVSNSDYCNALIVQNKKRSIISYIIILGISLILVQFSLPYAKASMLVLLINTCLMLQLQIVNCWKGRLNDDYSSNHY